MPTENLLCRDGKNLLPDAAQRRQATLPGTEALKMRRSWPFPAAVQAVSGSDDPAPATPVAGFADWQAISFVT